MPQLPPPAATEPALAQWRERLREVRLPRLAGDMDLRLLGGDQVAPRRLLEHALHEPAFALEVLREANARRRAGEELRGLEHGLKLLGTARAQRLMRLREAEPFDTALPAHRLCLAAMASTRLGWLYLAYWLRQSLASDEDQRLSLLSLLGVVRAKLTLAAPEQVAEIEQRVATGERRGRVEKALLGCSVEALTAAHLHDLGFADAEQWARALALSPRLLARSAQAVRRHPDAPLPEPLARALRQRLLGCSLAYALALETQVDWYSRRCAHLQQAAAAWLGRTHEDVLRGLQRQALFASNEKVFTQGLRAPAVGLLWPPRQPRSLPMRNAMPVDAAAAPTERADQAEARQASPSAPPRHDQAGSRAVSDPLGAYLQHCSQGGFADLRGLLSASLALFKMLGFTRSALFLRQPGGERLALYFSQGLDAALAPRGLALDATAVGLLPRLLAQPGTAFWLQPAQLRGIGGKLPEALAAWPPAGGFALASVAVNARSVGFWWVDAADGELDAARFAAFRRAAGGFGPEFNRLLRKQREAAATAASG
jgi:hypothetical protein